MQALLDVISFLGGTRDKEPLLRPNLAPRAKCKRPRRPVSHALNTVRNITIRYVRYSLRPLVFYLFNSLFVTDPVSNAGLGSVYTVFLSKTKIAERLLF